MMNGENPAERFDRAKLVAAYAAGELEALVRDARKVLEDPAWSLLRSEIAAAHDAGEIDILAAVSASGEGRLPYSVQELLEKVLPDLSVTLDDILASLPVLSRRWHAEQGTPYYILNAVGSWCDRAPGRPLALLDAIRQGRASNDLLRASLWSGMRTAQAEFMPLIIALLEADSTAERAVAADVLGQVEPDDPADQTLIVTALELALTTGDGEQAVAPFRALLQISRRETALAAIGLRAIEIVRPRLDAHIRTAAATELMLAQPPFPDALESVALQLLRSTEAGEAATIGMIDLVIEQRLDAGPASEAIRLLDHLLSHGVITMRMVDSTAHALLTGDVERLKRTAIRWLVSHDLALVKAIDDLKMANPGVDLLLDLDFVGEALTAGRAISIARMTSATLMIFPETLTSILVSLLRTGPKDALPELEELIFDPLLVSYWRGPRPQLEAAAAAGPLKVSATIERVLARLDAYSTAIEKVGIIKELQPSERQRFISAVKRHEEQRKITKVAEGASVFTSIFPTSLSLYGDSAIFDVHVEPGRTVRSETQFQFYEVSHEIPRLDVIDPFGHWYKRYMLRQGEDG
jgi:hypothetical protein